VFDNQTAEQQASRNAEDFLIAGNMDFTPQYTRHIQEVTREQVAAAARKYLNRDHLLTTVLLPMQAPDPFAPKAAATQAGAGPVAVKKVVLKNGVTLLISRNAAAPLACFNLYTMGGLLAEDDSNNGIGTLMMNLMARETTTRSHEQIADFLDATGASLSATSASNVFQLSMACLKDKAAESFSVFADVALHPKFSGEELKQIRHSLISTAETATEDWSGEAFKTVRDLFYASSPYKRVPEGDSAVIEKLTPEEIAAHYKNYFLDPAHMVIAISGDIDPEAALAWAQPFEAIAPHNPTLNVFSVPEAAKTVVKPTAKQSATVMLAYPGANISSADRHALIVLKTYFSGYSSPGGSLLFETLRGKGLVYTVDAANTCWPAGGLFLITALGEPKNTGAIVGNIQQVIETVKRGEVTRHTVCRGEGPGDHGREAEQTDGGRAVVTGGAGGGAGAGLGRRGAVPGAD
jgi:zinc protease